MVMLVHDWSAPEVLEAVRRQLGIAHGMLNVLVPEIRLQRSSIVAGVGKSIAAAVAKHVWVDREWHLCGLPDTLDEAMEADGAYWPAALGNEYVGVLGVIAS